MMKYYCPHFTCLLFVSYLLLLLLLLLHVDGILSLKEHNDRDALLSFKSQINDPNNYLSNWTSNPNSSHCNWYGVSCSSKFQNRVQSLSLQNLNLSGTIPSSLSNLSRLHLLDLSNNSLTGRLPPQLGNLSSLTYLSLAKNHFSGTVPPQLASLQNLTHLSLFDNNLSGDFPASIFNLSSLIFISLTNNNLSGTLPQNFHHSLPNLRSLFLANNMFRGVIPASISNSSHLEYLDLSNNQFRGWVPLLNNLDNLSNLNLGSNRLSSSTRLNSQLFNSLRNSTRLRVLRLYSNQLAGQLPSSVANLSSNLEYFCLANNFLTGTIPSGMGKFRNLSSLSFENNRFTGAIPVDIGALNNLVEVSLYENRLSGEIPDILGNFTQLSELWLNYNQFTGRIPASVGQCKHLNSLDLGMNRLQETIPKEIFELSGLNTLYLTGNALTGSLPSEVSSLKMIQTLDISDNQFFGLIPEAIGECSGLQSLIMARNNFSGSIPSKMGNLGSLETLDISSNNLSGQIPEKLEKLQYMVNLNLSFNHLEGQIPTNGLFTNLTKFDLRGNTKLCSLNNTTARQLGILLCTSKKKRSFFLPITLGVAGAIVFLVFFLVLFWVTMYRRNKRKIIGGPSPAPLKGVHETISYGEIKLATKNFAAENLIGKGGFGYVYKGEFNICNTGEEAMTLAVKVMDLKQSKASKSFNAECEALKIVRHRNLVKVITSCSSIDHKGDEFKALIMQFMPNGNLDTWLHPIMDTDIEEQTRSSLNVLQRLNIAIDVASALEYLHHDCEPPIVHCDLKPSNILLDENMVAHVGDFGLARLLSQNPSRNHESSTLGLKGSIGYIAPEYGEGGKVSTHGDVYNFGILLLEMFIAKRPSDEMFNEGFSLTKLASTVMGTSDSNQVMKVADLRLFKDYEHSTQSSSTSGRCGTSDDDTMENCSSNNNNNTRKVSLMRKLEKCICAVIEVGLCCAVKEAKDRLNMKEASKKLQGIKHSMHPF